MSARLTRQDMKRDEVQEWMGRAYIWLGDHWRKLVWGAAAVVAVGLAAVLTLAFLEHRAGQAQRRLSEALEVYDAPINAISPTPDDPESPSFASEDARRERAGTLLTDIHDRYGSTTAGRIAGVYLGRIAAAHGDFDRARELWNDFLEKAPGHALAASVQLDLYSLDRQQDRFEEAIASLRAAVDEPASRVPVDALLHELGITLEAAGQKEEAHEVFQRLVDEYPASPYADSARQRVGSGAGLGNFQIGT